MARFDGNPILEPFEDCERKGWVPNVGFGCC